MHKSMMLKDKLQKHLENKNFTQIFAHKNQHNINSPSWTCLEIFMALSSFINRLLATVDFVYQKIVTSSVAPYTYSLTCHIFLINVLEMRGVPPQMRAHGASAPRFLLKGLKKILKSAF